MGPKQFGPGIAPVTMNQMPVVPGNSTAPGPNLQLDPLSLEEEIPVYYPVKQMTGIWGEFRLDWDDAT